MDVRDVSRERLRFILHFPLFLFSLCFFIFFFSLSLSLSLSLCKPERHPKDRVRWRTFEENPKRERETTLLCSFTLLCSIARKRRRAREKETADAKHGKERERDA